MTSSRVRPSTPEDLAGRRLFSCLACWTLISPARPDVDTSTCPDCGEELLAREPGTVLFECHACGSRGQLALPSGCPDCGELVRMLIGPLDESATPIGGPRNLDA